MKDVECQCNVSICFRSNHPISGLCRALASESLAPNDRKDQNIAKQVEIINIRYRLSNVYQRWCLTNCRRRESVSVHRGGIQVVRRRGKQFLRRPERDYAVFIASPLLFMDRFRILIYMLAPFQNINTL